MLLDQATGAEMQAAHILLGATMAGFLGASLFRRQTARLRWVITGLYLAAVLAFVVYVLV